MCSNIVNNLEMDKYTYKKYRGPRMEPGVILFMVVFKDLTI